MLAEGWTPEHIRGDDCALWNRRPSRSYRQDDHARRLDRTLRPRNLRGPRRCVDRSLDSVAARAGDAWPCRSCAWRAWCRVGDPRDVGDHGDALWPAIGRAGDLWRAEEHTSELQSLMRISYAVFCLKKNKNRQKQQ